MGDFFTHPPVTCARLTQRLGSARPVGQRTYVMSFCVDWASHSVAAGFEIEHLTGSIQKANVPRC